MGLIINEEVPYDHGLNLPTGTYCSFTGSDIIIRKNQVDRPYNYINEENNEENNSSNEEDEDPEAAGRPSANATSFNIISSASLWKTKEDRVSNINNRITKITVSTNISSTDLDKNIYTILYRILKNRFKNFEDDN